MNRRLPVVLAVVAVAAAGTVPAVAAKAKPKPIKGSYTLELYPDATPNVTTLADESVTCGVLPQSIDKRAFTFPAAGTLTVDLTVPDPIPAASPVHGDWDLYILDGTSVRNSSHTEFANEHTVDKLKRKTALTFMVCNLTGLTKGTVSYTFTYA